MITELNICEESIKQFLTTYHSQDKKSVNIWQFRKANENLKVIELESR